MLEIGLNINARRLIFCNELANSLTLNIWEARVLRLSRRAINNGNFAGVYFVCEYFTENVWELVTAPPDSLPSRQNSVENRDKTYRSFSHDVTAAILVYQNNETAAILVYQTNPVGVKLFSYVKTFFCSNKFT